MGFLKDTLVLARKEFFTPIGAGGRVLGFTGRLPDERDYESLIGDGSNSSLVQACVAWIANAFAQSEPAVLTLNDAGDYEAPDVAHPVSTLIRRPTYDPRTQRSYYGWRPFIQATLTSYVCDGNAYWLKIRSQAGRVVQLWYVPHWMMEPWWEIGSTQFIAYYRYSPSFGGPGGNTYTEIDPRDVVHFRDGLDPSNTRKGFSKVKTLLREVYTDEEAARWTASLLKNQAVPGLVVSPGQGWVPQEDDLKDAKARIEAAVSGDNKGRVLMTSGPTTVQSYGFNPEQMQLGDIRNVPEERVSALLGIPAAVVGFGTGLEMTKVGATMAELVDLAWQNGVMPKMRVLSGEIEEQLFPDFGIEYGKTQFHFDTSKVPIMADYRNKEADTLEKLMRWSLVRRKEGRRKLNLPVGPRDDVYVLSSGLTEVDANKTIEEAPAIKPITETAPVAAVPGEGAPPAAVAAPATRPALPPGGKAAVEAKPVGPFPDFAACVAHMQSAAGGGHSEESARKICGAMEQMMAGAKALTPREREIGALMASKTNREIADALTISERTVETHVASVLAKLGLHDRHQVAIS